MDGKELQDVVSGVLGRTLARILVFYNPDLCVNSPMSKHFLLVKPLSLFKYIYLENEHLQSLFPRTPECKLSHQNFSSFTVIAT